MKNPENQKGINASIIAGFFLIAFLLFAKAFFSSETIQGTDISLGYTISYTENLSSTPAVWDNQTWIGLPLGNARIALSNLFAYLGASTMIQPLSYATSIFLSILFMFLFLERLGLKKVSTVFGAVAYGLTPHFITLIFSGHMGVLDMVFCPPAIFYFLTVAFDGKEKNFLKKNIPLLVSGSVWAMMMVNAPQRGIYFSVVLAFYLLHLWKNTHALSLKEPEGFKKTAPWIDALRVGVVAVFLGLSFLSGLDRYIGYELSGSESKTEMTEDEKWEFSTSWSFHPKEIIDSIAFGYHGTASGDEEKPYWGEKPFSGNSEAIGFFVLLFAALAAVALWKKEKKVRFFIVSGLVALILSFGKYFPGTPFYYLWFKLPMMDQFRVPAKFLAVSAFSASVLSAYGINVLSDWIENNDSKSLSLTSKILGGAAALSIIWTVIAAFSAYAPTAKADEAMTLSLLRMSIFSVLSLALFWVSTKLKNENLRKWIPALFIPMALFDLGSIDHFFIQKSYVDPDTRYSAGSFETALSKSPGNFRIASSLRVPYGTEAYPLYLVNSGLVNEWNVYTLPYFGIESLESAAVSRVPEIYENFFYHTLAGSYFDTNRVDLIGLQNSMSGLTNDITDLINLNLRLLRLCNVKYLVSDLYLEGSMEVSASLLSNENLTFAGQAADGYYGYPVYFFEISDTLPRAGFYENYLIAQSAEDSLNNITNTAYDIQSFTTVVIEGQISQGSFDHLGSTVLAVPLSEYRSGYAKMSLENDNPGILTLRNYYDPGWQVRIDGETADLLQTDYAFMGVLVEEPGIHTVEFEYRPNRKIFYVSLFSTLLAFALSVAFFLIPKKEEE